MSTTAETHVAFQVGQFRTYMATCEGISLGFINTNGDSYKPQRGEEIQYDGSTVILRDGREFTEVPQLRSAIREKWFVLVEGSVPVPRPKPAGIQVRETEHRGFERPVRNEIPTVSDEERTLGSIEDRQKRREHAEVEAARRPVTLRSPEAQAAMSRSVWASGDREIDRLVLAIEDELSAWKKAQRQAPPVTDVNALAEADVAGLWDFLAAPKASHHITQARRPDPSDSPRPTRLPVDRDENLRMEVRRGDDLENEGPVVGNVRDHQARLEQERQIDLSLSPAKPVLPTAPKRVFGGALVVDEQRHLGDIALSNNQPAIRLDESAKVRPAPTESVRGGEVEVGTRQKAASKFAMQEPQEGVAVGRILTPAVREFVADDSTTSSTAIQALGTKIQVEKIAPIATGDVEEARSGDALEELLPNAVTPPKAARPVLPLDQDPLYKAIKAAMPDFEWNRDRKSPERVSEAVRRHKEKEFLQAVLQIETDYVRGEIEKELTKMGVSFSSETPATTAPENA